jgi:tetratricopeptide (TPR) repeat protein
MAMDAGSELDPELRQLATLVRIARSRGDDNYILRRGAILHADVAILAPQSMAAPGEVARPTGGLERFRMEISDGQEIDLHQSAIHWEIARMLLDFVRPRGVDHADPGHDEMVRQWYRATAAWMQLREDHDKLHLDRARAIFPNDPDILFLSACQRETYAGVPIQTAVRSASLPTGVTIDVGSERVELREAEGLFRRALEIKSDHTEARLRYGRVLGALGRHDEAAVQLRRAVADLTDRQLLYYAELFLGGEEEALGNRDAARVAYEQAAGISPMAQSPLLALSQLARRSADRNGALRAIARLFALRAEERADHDDPWWWYYVIQARDADDLLEAMRRPYLTERLQ